MTHKHVSSAWLSRETALYGWVYLLFQLFLLPSLLNAVNGVLARPLSKTELNFTFYLINFLVVCVIFHHFLGASFREAFWHPAYLLQAVILGLCAYYACTWAVTRAISYFDPSYTNINDSSIADLSKGNWYLMAVGTVILVPLAEECFYRGLVFRLVYPRSRWLAYVLSILVFAAIHVLGYVGKFSVQRLLLCFVQYLPAGLCLAWSYAKSDTIFAPILIHAVINARSIYLLR